MKQRLLILAAATAVAFAACNGSNNEGSYSQAQVDSIARVKTDSIAAALKAQTDSTIAAQAKAAADSSRIADSLAKATTKGASATNIKKNSKPTKPAKPVVKEEEPKKEEPKPQVRTAEDIKKDKKAAEFGDNAAKARLDQDKRDKKAAEFGDKDAQKRLNETKSSKKADEFK